MAGTTGPTGLSGEPAVQFLDRLVTLNPVVAALCVMEGRAEVGSICARLHDVFVTVTERRESSIACRRVAACTLGRLGDRRIWEDREEPLVPRLIELPAGEYHVGLSQADLKRVYSLLKRLQADLDQGELKCCVAELRP